jgi:flavin reductase (DIM6/NTAB) family NADH-FMN oxidoreductase RutF
MKKSLGAHNIPCLLPVWVIATYDSEGRPNAATAAWVGVCASDPPAVSVSLRKGRYTYENIMLRRAFTVNIPAEHCLGATDYYGTVSGRQHDKLSETGFTPVRSELVDAPYIEEFPCVMECDLQGSLEVGSHVLLIGEVVDVKADEAILANGLPDVARLKPVLAMPAANAYYGAGQGLGKVRSRKR